MASQPSIIVVVAPRSVAVRVVAVGTPCVTHLFDSLDELDAWRASGPVAHHDIAVHVDAVLRQIACEVEEFSDEMRALIDWIRRAHHTPHLKQVAALWSSRRSFFRAWSAAIPQTPGRFLAHVRCLHAWALVEAGHAPAQSAKAAGFATLHALQRESELLAHTSPNWHHIAVAGSPSRT